MINTLRTQGITRIEKFGISIEIPTWMYRLSQLVFSAALILIVLVPLFGMDFWTAASNVGTAAVCIAFYLLLVKKNKKQ